MAGYFLEDLDWSDPRFAPYDLENLGELNKRQLNLIFEEDFEDRAFPEYSEEEQIQICLTVPCRVELDHSNVCYGSEKSWPKRMFDKPDFASLEAHEKEIIWRKMERNGTNLFKTYVNEERLGKRRRRRSKRGMATFNELRYRRNYYNLMKKLADPEPTSQPEPALIIDIDDSDTEVEQVDNDNDDDDDESVDGTEEDLSMNTVINTGNYQSPTENSNTTNQQDLSPRRKVPNRKKINGGQKSTDLNSNTIDVDDIDDQGSFHSEKIVFNLDIGTNEGAHRIDDEDLFTNVELNTLSNVVSTQNNPENDRTFCLTPDIDDFSEDQMVIIATPNLHRLQNDRADEFGENQPISQMMSLDVGTQFFSSQLLHGKTSTQQSN